MCWCKSSFKYVRKKVTNLEWLQTELDHIYQERSHNQEFNQYDGNPMYCTSIEIKCNTRMYNDIELDLDRREKQLIYFITRTS